MMSQPRRLSPFLLALAVLVWPARGDERQVPTNPKPDAIASRVYGEWRIRVRPDKGPDYNRLIEQSGLPLFREAGGRMVGWWNTLDRRPLRARDDLGIRRHGGVRAGDRVPVEEPGLRPVRRGARPAPGRRGEPIPAAGPGRRAPSLPEPAPFVVHEIHRVPLARRDAYLDFMTKQGLGLLKANGFRPVGPWVVDVGRWSEVTYLFRFESLAERERLIAKFSATADARTYGAKVGEFADEVTTRLLIPAPFAKPAPAETPRRSRVVRPSCLIASRSRRAFMWPASPTDYGSANCGWVALGEETLLIDLPRGIPVPEFLALVAATTGKPARTLVLTHVQDGDTADHSGPCSNRGSLAS